VSRLATGAGHGSLFGGRRREVKHLGESGGCDLKYGGARHSFDRLQIQRPGLSAARKEYVKPLVCFPGDFLMDRKSRFFSPVSTRWLPARPTAACKSFR
jgi:hypothetical protein